MEKIVEAVCSPTQTWKALQQVLEQVLNLAIPEIYTIILMYARIPVLFHLQTGDTLVLRMFDPPQGFVLVQIAPLPSIGGVQSVCACDNFLYVFTLSRINTEFLPTSFLSQTYRLNLNAMLQVQPRSSITNNWELVPNVPAQTCFVHQGRVIAVSQSPTQIILNVYRPQDQRWSTWTANQSKRNDKSRLHVKCALIQDTTLWMAFGRLQVESLELPDTFFQSLFDSHPTSETTTIPSKTTAYFHEESACCWTPYIYGWKEGFVFVPCENCNQMFSIQQKRWLDDTKKVNYAPPFTHKPKIVLDHDQTRIIMSWMGKEIVPFYMTINSDSQPILSSCVSSPAVCITFPAVDDSGHFFYA